MIFFCRYDPECDSWSMVAPMLMPRGGVGVAGLGGYLYAVGGNDGAASLQSVERYNPHTNKWSRVAPMNRRRAGRTVYPWVIIFQVHIQF